MYIFVVGDTSNFHFNTILSSLESVSMVSSKIHVPILDIAHGHNTHANIDVIQIQLKMWKCCENLSVGVVD